MNQQNPNDTFGPRDADFEHNACLGYTGFEIRIIADGFRSGANILADHARENDSRLDELIYPIAYNFRQAIELTLKACLLLAHRLFQPQSKQPSGHDLNELWHDLKPWVERRFMNDPDYAQIPKIEEILNDFVSVDPTSMSFRYATNKRGRPLLDRLPNINVVQLQERANSLLSLLNTIEGALNTDLS